MPLEEPQPLGRQTTPQTGRSPSSRLHLVPMVGDVCDGRRYRANEGARSEAREWSEGTLAADPCLCVQPPSGVVGTREVNRHHRMEFLAQLSSVALVEGKDSRVSQR